MAADQKRYWGTITPLAAPMLGMLGAEVALSLVVGGVALVLLLLALVL